MYKIIILYTLNIYKFYFLKKVKQNTSQSLTPCMNLEKVPSLPGSQFPIYGEKELDLLIPRSLLAGALRSSAQGLLNNSELRVSGRSDPLSTSTQHQANGFFCHFHSSTFNF